MTPRKARYVVRFNEGGPNWVVVDTTRTCTHEDRCSTGAGGTCVCVAGFAGRHAARLEASALNQGLPPPFPLRRPLS